VGIGEGKGEYIGKRGCTPLKHPGGGWRKLWAKQRMQLGGRVGIDIFEG
jgi:hypothetical protein